MPDLYVYEVGRKAGEERIWPSPGLLSAGKIQEAREYIFEFRDTADAQSVDLFIDDIRLEALRSQEQTTARWRWSPGFHAGTITIGLRGAGMRAEQFELVTDPELRKLTRDRFDTMTREILEDTFALFSLSAFRIGIGHGTGGPPPAIARLEFLRSRLAELELVVREIDRRPVRVLEAVEEVAPYYKVQSATGPELARSFRTGPVLKESDTSGRLSKRLRGYFPAKIRKTVKTSGFDIKEHRDIKACLTGWSSWLGVVADRLEGLGQAVTADDELRETNRVWELRCRTISRRLQDLLKLPLFIDVSEQASPVVATSIYRRIMPYRRFFMLYRDISLGIANITGDFLQVPLSRTYELYEVWVFLRLLRACVARFGPSGLDVDELFSPSLSTGSLTLAAGAVTVRVGGGFTFAFQRTYTEYWITSDRRGSFSRRMIPDLALSGTIASGGPEKLIILDAKYRVSEGLNEAISSIHMYRDALVEEDGALGSTTVRRIVSGAYLVSPDAPDYEATWQNSKMPNRLFHPDYRASFRFGAITLIPGMDTVEIDAALDAILRDVGIVP